MGLLKSPSKFILCVGRTASLGSRPSTTSFHLQSSNSFVVLSLTVLLYTASIKSSLLKMLTAIKRDGCEDLVGQPPRRPVGYPACGTHTSRLFSYSKLSPVVLDTYVWATEQSPWCQSQGKLNSFPASTGQSRLVLPCSHVRSCKYPRSATCPKPELDLSCIFSCFCVHHLPG